MRRYRPPGRPGAPHHPFTLAGADTTTAAAVCHMLAIPDGLVAGVAVNDEAAELDTPLAPGDTLALFPPSAGG